MFFDKMVKKSASQDIKWQVIGMMKPGKSYRDINNLLNVMSKL